MEEEIPVLVSKACPEVSIGISPKKTRISTSPSSMVSSGSMSQEAKKEVLTHWTGADWSIYKEEESTGGKVFKSNFDNDPLETSTNASTNANVNYGTKLKKIATKNDNIKITDNGIIPLKERVAGAFYDPLAWLLKNLTPDLRKKSEKNKL